MASEETDIALLKQIVEKHIEDDAKTNLAISGSFELVNRRLDNLNRTGLAVLLGICAWLAVQVYTNQNNALAELRHYQAEAAAKLLPQAKP